MYHRIFKKLYSTILMKQSSGHTNYYKTGLKKKSYLRSSYNALYTLDLTGDIFKVKCSVFCMVFCIIYTPALFR